VQAASRIVVASTEEEETLLERSPCLANGWMDQMSSSSRMMTVIIFKNPIRVNKEPMAAVHLRRAPSYKIRCKRWTHLKPAR